MSKKPDGGPAFPVEPQGAWLPDCSDPDGAPMREFPGHPGMSLRDYFAGQALAGISGPLAMTSQASIEEAARVDGFSGTRGEYTAKRCYAIADAMLEERDK